MIAYDFSKLNTREKRVYSFADVSISSTGIATKLIGICAVLLAVSAVINIPIGILTKTYYFSPFTQGAEINTWGILLVWGIPIGIGCLLYFTRVSNYRLIDLIVLYLKPKQPISIGGKRITHDKIVFDAFLER